MDNISYFILNLKNCSKTLALQSEVGLLTSK